MEIFLNKNRFTIFTGKRFDGRILFAKPAGDAYEFEESGKHYFLIKMWANMKETYYLCKNRDNENYTLFSGKIGDEGCPVFQRPIGYGALPFDLKTHLEIQFTFPRQRVFMSLFPTNDTRDLETSEFSQCA